MEYNDKNNIFRLPKVLSLSSAQLGILVIKRYYNPKLPPETFRNV